MSDENCDTPGVTSKATRQAPVLGPLSVLLLILAAGLSLFWLVLAAHPSTGQGQEYLFTVFPSLLGKFQREFEEERPQFVERAVVGGSEVTAIGGVEGIANLWQYQRKRASEYRTYINLWTLGAWVSFGVTWAAKKWPRPSAGIGK